MLLHGTQASYLPPRGHAGAAFTPGNTSKRYSPSRAAVCAAAGQQYNTLAVHRKSSRTTLHHCSARNHMTLSELRPNSTALTLHHSITAIVYPNNILQIDHQMAPTNWATRGGCRHPQGSKACSKLLLIVSSEYSQSYHHGHHHGTLGSLPIKYVVRTVHCFSFHKACCQPRPSQPHHE